MVFKHKTVHVNILFFQWKPRHINRDSGPRTITEIRKEAGDVRHTRHVRLLSSDTKL
jgi:hypothetical protein